MNLFARGIRKRCGTLAATRHSYFGFESSSPLRTADATASLVVVCAVLSASSKNPQTCASDLCALAIAARCSIGMFAPIRVEWWLAHAHQRFHRPNDHATPRPDLARRGVGYNCVRGYPRHMPAT